MQNSNESYSDINSTEDFPPLSATVQSVRNLTLGSNDTLQTRPRATISDTSVYNGDDGDSHGSQVDDNGSSRSNDPTLTNSNRSSSHLDQNDDNGDQSFSRHRRFQNVQQGDESWNGILTDEERRNNNQQRQRGTNDFRHGLRGMPPQRPAILYLQNIARIQGDSYDDIKVRLAPNKQFTIPPVS